MQLDLFEWAYRERLLDECGVTCFSCKAVDRWLTVDAYIDEVNEYVYLVCQNVLSDEDGNLYGICGQKVEQTWSRR